MINKSHSLPSNIIPKQQSQRKQQALDSDSNFIEEQQQWDTTTIQNLKHDKTDEQIQWKTQPNIPPYQQAIDAVKIMKKYQRVKTIDKKEMADIAKLNDSVYENDSICCTPWVIGAIGIILLCIVYYSGETRKT